MTAGTLCMGAVQALAGNLRKSGEQRQAPTGQAVAGQTLHS